MPLFPTSSYGSVVQLCDSINDWTNLPFDREQYRSLYEQLGEQTAWLTDRQFEELRSQITTAYNQLKRWSVDYVVRLSRELEVRHA